MAKMKASKIEADSDFDSNTKVGKWIINDEPSAMVTTTKFGTSEPEEL